jgi:hypothetical protein
MKPSATMIPTKATLSVANLAALLAMIKRKLKRAQKLSAQLEELVYDAASHFDDLCGMFGSSGGSPSGSVQLSGHLVVAQASGQVPIEPPREVSSVVLRPHGDGRATVQFDERPGIVLPPLVVVLLGILKAENDVGKDHLVGWKSVAHIQSSLKGHTQRQHSEAAVKNLVYRLRNLLEDHGENRLLVQEDDRLGYRLAVRCAPGAAADRDNQ